jgi:cysteine desulfuration protein SufE
MSDERALPAGLAAIVADFQSAERDEQLELLLEYADRLPTPPADWPGRPTMEQVHECQSPVFLSAELVDGAVVYTIDVPREAPTTRGVASLLREGLAGLTPADIVAVPADLINRLGLQRLLSPQRVNGAAAVLAYMKRQALRLAERN